MGTEFYVGNDIYFVQGVDTVSNSNVKVGVAFNDQPFSPYASDENPMKFGLFPVGVYTDGRFESVSRRALYWVSTNNFFGGSTGELQLTRNNAVPDGLSGTILEGNFGSLSLLSPSERALLTLSGYVGDFDEPIVVPIPPSIFLVLFGALFLALLRFGNRFSGAYS